MSACEMEAMSARPGGTMDEKPKVLRFFFGKLKPTSDWQKNLVEKFK